MKDEILKGYIEDFSEQNGLNNGTFEDTFERFVNYCVISKQYPREFNYEDISVGGSGDSAIDGVAIIVNGNIVQNPEEIDFFLRNNGSLSVSFSFIQSKTSAKFNGAQILNFLAGIRNFFSDNSAIPENEDIKALRAIKDRVYKNSIKFDAAPVLNLFFVTTGDWQEPTHITGLVKSELEVLHSRRLFSTNDGIVFQCVDAERLKQMYREIRGRSLKEIDLPSLVSLPEIQGVRQSFVGSVSTVEYIKLVTDDEGNLQKNLFYDNVRDYQGNTPVNAEIDKTLKSDSGQAALAIYNNGITIIAKKVERISGKVKLTDYQIVNGCQTSHVLFMNRQLLKDDSHIIIKIIETTDQEVAVSVIKATNRQTEVKVEAFESLSPFHKDLDEYYKAKAGSRKHQIFYERRSKQYDNMPGIRDNQVITLSAQIKAYVSASLAQPQSTHRYFGEILESNRERMFASGESLEKYYAAAAILNRLECLFRKGAIGRRYKSYKYLLVYMVYYYFTKTIERRNSSELFNELLISIDDDSTIMPIVIGATKSIDNGLKRLKLSHQDGVRSKALTDLLAKELTDATKAR